MMTDVWTKREAGPLAVYCHEGSYAYDNCDAVLARYQKALDDVCLFLDVQRDSNSVRIRLDGSNYDAARYGNTDLTLRISVERLPKKCLLRFSTDERLIEGEPDTRADSPGPALLFNIPIQATELEVIL